jgi:hypothetical protein
LNGLKQTLFNLSDLTLVEKSAQLGLKGLGRTKRKGGAKE